MQPSQALLALSLRRPRSMLAAAAVLALAATPGLLRLRHDNSPSVFFPRSAEARAQYERFVATFGGDTALRVVGRADAGAVFDEKGWAALERRLTEIQGVRAVLGPASWAQALAADHPDAADTAVGRALGWRLPASGGRSALLLLEEGGAESQRATVRAVEATLAAASSATLRLEAVGFPVLAAAFDGAAREFLLRSFPLLVLAASGLLFWIFRDFGGVVVPLLFVAWNEVILLGLMGWVGVPLNMILGVLPPILFVVALATAIHIVTRERELRRAEAGVPVGTAFRDKGRAVLWTTASAAAGFGALTTTDVGPVRSVGLWAAAGCVLVGFATFAVLPALLVLSERVRKPGFGAMEATLHRLGCVVAEASLHRFALVLWTTIGLGVLALVGVSRLETESNALRYLWREHPARAGIERLESEGVGTAAVEAVLRAAEPMFEGGAGANRLSWIALRLREETGGLGVLGVLSAGDVVDDALRSDAAGALAPGGAAPRALALERLRSTDLGRRALDALVSPDGRSARLTLLVRAGQLRELDALRAQAAAVLAEECEGCEISFTGQYPMLLESQGLLLGTLGRSSALAVVSVAAILWLLVRRVRLTLLALVPNVVPGLLVFGAMGWLGQPIDLATVMVAATTFGLALDDTIHTLVPFREQVRDQPTAEAVLRTVEKNATAYSVSGLVLGLGFLACALSVFRPIQRFGLLSAAAIAVAVLADFLLVPALLGGAPRSVLVKPSRARR